MPSLHDGRVWNGTRITPGEDDGAGLARLSALVQQDGNASLVEPLEFMQNGKSMRQWECESRIIIITLGLCCLICYRASGPPAMV